MSHLNITTSTTIAGSRLRHLFIAACGGLILAVAAPAGAHEPEKAVSIDDHEATTVIEQLTASEARRRAYQYLEELGYMNHSSVGAARVRGMTREGDTWIARVAYSTGGRVLSQHAVLYINAQTAFVSEQPPKNFEGRVAAQ